MEEQIRDNSMRAFVVPVQVLEDAQLNVFEKMVYIVLRSFCNPHRMEAWPSIAKICELSGIGRTKVKETLASLESKGYIQKRLEFKYDQKSKKARQSSNVYTIELPQINTISGRHTTGDGVATRPGGGRHTTGGGSPHDHQELNQLELNQEKDDDDDSDSVAASVFNSFKSQIGKPEFEKVLNRVRGRATGNFKEYLTRAVLNEIKNLEQEDLAKYLHEGR